MTSLIAAAIVFVLLHLGVAGTRLRDRVVALLGERAYLGLFSLLSLVVIVWLAGAYARAPYLPTWGMLPAWRWVMVVLMLPAMLLVVIGLATPSPTAVGQERRAAEPVRGILRITRHPFLTGVALWAVLHLIGNGDGASLVFFGAFAVVAILGPASIDEKRQRRLGAAAWTPFAAQTSIIPFAAILAGRNQLVLAELGWWRVLAGLVVYALVLGGHGPLFGISPLG